ncbi:glycoside hydrolase family 13 protein [Clostridium gasigenes]|uniref:Neopullulanase n=1 Tax=Clostridium gasigenes TaxID=94869 RepID=A0A1H0QQG0_9CLOT|nr:glycoside hydrolase family 13 protein [Clostridium gasigenes]MBB6625145.1 alpha-glycosidase [Clostridium gasigenes]SDP19355.1 neopullulanase [Clostridium gasigenes]
MKKTITREAIYHSAQSNYSYGYDSETLHLRVKTKKNEVKSVIIRIGDPYIWDAGGCDGGNMNATGGVWVGGKSYPMRKECETEYFDNWIIEYKPDMKRSRYAFILEGYEETLLYTEKGSRELNGDEGDERKLCKLSDFFCFPYLNNIDVARGPEWVKNTVWYQIFPDRFCNGDKSINPINVQDWGTEPTGENFMGGDLQGIINKLDYLEDLGITGLYLCPIFEATTNHRYDTIDYFKVDSTLGDEKTFKKLVEESHKRGIKIMLDAVFNHLGYFSAQWQDVVKYGEESKYKDWFYIKKFPAVDRPLEELDGNNLNYESFGRTPLMPKLNTENNEVVKHLLKVAKYWVEDMKIDAWRLDVCNEVDHVFWRKFREVVKGINKEVYILGEVWHDGLPWLMGDQFDAVMNYPLTEAIKEYFCLNDISGEKFRYMVEENKVAYSRQVGEVTFNLLDSHDTPRMLTVANGDKEKMKLAYLFMFTQAGSPCIYYGDEVGMEGEQGMGREFHRRCMVWEDEKQDKEFQIFMKKIIGIRKEYEEFKLLDNRWISYCCTKEALVYSKGNITILINNSNEMVDVMLPEEIRNEKVFNLYDLTNEELVESVSMEANSFRIFKIN